MNINEILTTEDFEKLTQRQFWELWYNQSLSYRKIGKMYGVDPKRVRQKRKELGLTYFASTYMGLSEKEKQKATKKVEQMRKSKNK